MKKNYKSIIIMVVILFTIVPLLNGCGSSGSVQDDIDKDLGGDLAGDVAGADVNTDNVWPASMPESVPEFTGGTIVSTSGIRVGGQNNISVILEDVTKAEFDAYIQELDGSSYEYLTGSDSGGITAKTYVDGENAISLQFAAKNGEMTFAFTGN